MEPCRFYLRGEVDVSNADGLLTTLRSAAGQHPAAPVLVDCMDLEFIDAAGLRVFVRIRRELAAEGRELHLVRPSPFLARILRVLDLDVLVSSGPLSSPPRPAMGGTRNA